MNLLLICPRPSIADNFDQSHSLLSQVLKEYIHDGLVNYKKLKDNPKKLDHYIKELDAVQKSDVSSWSRNERIAFWINAYNALTIKAIIDHYPVQAAPLSFVNGPKNSIRQIPGVWDKLKFHVMGRILSLDEIEHDILRRQFKEPRVHMALVCASIGCPSLREEAYTGAQMEDQLEDQARLFLANPKKFKIIHKKNMVRLSAIFKWFGDDFVESYGPSSGFSGHPKTMRASLNFISKYLKATDREFLQKEKYRVKWYRYDWTLNDFPSTPKAPKKTKK
ncbi:MAG: DUF547 domain-containing protein [Elusimicrobia bacterium]|nr:DUF547 domain-containing protein [Elusimicrobiota bacterium]